MFSELAQAGGLLPAGFRGTKKQVRDAIRRLDDGENKWQRLQGQVYGAHMPEAELIEGVGEFLLACRDRDLAVIIVSHKTEFGHFDPNRVNLRHAATAWMEKKRFFDANGFAINRRNVFFESTREAKINRIAAVGCTHFIDDLAEVFIQDGFPPETRKYLFSPGGGPDGPFQTFSSWNDLARDILGDLA